MRGRHDTTRNIVEDVEFIRSGLSTQSALITKLVWKSESPDYLALLILYKLDGWLTLQTRRNSIKGKSRATGGTAPSPRAIAYVLMDNRVILRF
jgi:hypothetical protein